MHESLITSDAIILGIFLVLQSFNELSAASGFGIADRHRRHAVYQAYVHAYYGPRH